MNLCKRRLLTLTMVFAALLAVQCAEDEGPINPYVDTESPLYVITGLAANPSMIEPGEQAIVELTLLDRKGRAVPGWQLQFTADLGSVTPKVTSNTEGVARATFMAPCSTGYATVVAFAEGAIAQSTNIQVAYRTLTVSPASILADGLSEATISITVVDYDGVPVEGAGVTFYSDRGSIQDSLVTTDAGGRASTVVVSEASRSDIAGIVQAAVCYGSKSYVEDASIAFRGVCISLSASPSQMPADGSSVSVVTARLSETTSESPISGVRFDFATSLGQIDASSTTDANGFARTTLLSSLTPGVATVRGRYASLMDSTQVTLGSLNLSITSDPTEAPADGRSVLVVTARLRDATSGLPITDAQINFSSSLGIIGATGYTNNNGLAQTTLVSSTTPGVARVKAAYGIVADSVNVAMNALSLTLDSDLMQMPADGISKSNITAWLREAASGVPVSGVVVRFKTSLGVIGASDVTDDNGFATATLISSTTPGVANVTAFFAGVADSLQIKLGSLQISVAAAYDKVVADGAFSQTVVATLKNDRNNPVSGVLIDFRVDRGSITGSAVTDSRGRAAVLLVSPSSPGGAKVIASFKEACKDTVAVAFEDPVIAVRSSPLSVAVDPSNSVEISAYAHFADASPVPDSTRVRFTTTQGTIAPSAVTASGIAAVDLRPKGVADNMVVVRARCGNSSQTTQVMFVPDAPSRVVCRATPSAISSDEGAFATVVAEVTDEYGNHIADGRVVAFSLAEGKGLVTESALTAGGIAAARFTPTVGGVVRVRATCGSVFGDAGIVVMAQAPGSIVASPDTAWMAVSGGHDRNQATIAARVFDSHTSPVVDSTAVTFEIEYGPGGGEYLDEMSLGYGPVTKYTTAGKAVVTVNSGTKPGTVVMKISAGDYVATSVKVGIATGSPDSIFVTANTNEVIVGPECIYVVAVGAIVRDEYNNPVGNGTPVYFTLDRSDVGMITPTTVTGGDFPCPEFTAPGNPGVARACMKFNSSAMLKAVEIIARCGSVESALHATVPVVTPVKWYLEADPLEVSGAAGDSVYVAGNLTDDCNNPIVGACLRFSVDGDGDIPPELSFGFTDEYGGFVTVLVIPPGTATGTTAVKVRLCGSAIEEEIEITID